jgi:hypothetical protein
MIAARCDREEANVLALNLANERATGKQSVSDARKFYAESVAMMMKQGKPNEYMTGLRFTAKGDHGDGDKPFAAVGTTGR